MSKICRNSNKKDLDYFVSMKLDYLKESSLMIGDKFDISKSKLKEEFMSILKSRNFVVLILECDDKVAGFMKIGLYKKRTVSYLEDIYIKKEFRGKGCGDFFFKQFIIYSKNKKVKKMGLGTRVENIPAINLYKKYGFEIIGYNFGKKL